MQEAKNGHITKTEAVSKTTPIHVLHVDDDPSFLEISKQILMDTGNFYIDHSLCVDEAFKKLETGNYDVVVSDFDMPQKSGLQFLKELREQNNTIPFILFTGKGREEVTIKALNLGADGYINKQGAPETVYGELVHIVLTSFEKRNSQKMLWQSEERFKKLVTNSKDVIMLTQADGIILYLSPACKNVLGYESSELIGKIPWIIHPDDLERVQNVFQSALSSKFSETLEYRILTKQGETKWVNHAFSQIWENGKLTQIVSNLTDITERKKADEAIVQSEAYYRLLADNIRDVIWTMDLEGHFTYMSPSVLQLNGYTPDEVLKQSIVDTITPDSARIVLEDLQRFWETGAVPSDYYELELPCKDGSTVWTEVNLSVLRNRAGKPKAFLGVSRNISERKKAEVALVCSEEKFRVYVESSPVAVFVANSKGDYEYVNEASSKLLGYSREELLRMNIRQVTFKEDIVAEPKSFVEVKATGRSLSEAILKSKDGLSVYVILNSVKLPDGKLMAFCENITERKNADDAFLASEKNYRATFESTGTATVIIEEDTSLSLVNTKFEKLSGYSKEEIEGKKCWTEFVVKEDLDMMNEQHRLRRIDEKAASTHYEFRFMDRYGEVKNILLTIAMIPGTTKAVASLLDITERKKAEEALRESEEKYRETIQNANVGIVAYHPDGKITILNPTMQKMTGYTIKEIPNLSQWFGKLYPNEKERQKIKDKWFKKLTEVGEVKEGQATIITKQGEQRIFLFDGFRLHSGDFIAFARDITDRVRAEAELEGAIDKLVLVNEKLGVVGSLTRHDVRNKLSVVTAYAYLLKKKHADQADIVEGLGKVEQSIKDSMRIFEFAKMYEQIGSEELFCVELEKPINEAVDLFSDLTIKIINECDGLTVLADSFLRQLFYNFIDNTRKYGNKTTTIRVHYEKDGSGELRLIYEDDGVGISAENKAKLFSESFSTGGSSGFGLFLIKKMMDVYGWQIREVGEMGKGARFIITIPEKNKAGQANYQIQIKPDTVPIFSEKPNIIEVI